MISSSCRTPLLLPGYVSRTMLKAIQSQFSSSCSSRMGYLQSSSVFRAENLKFDMAGVNQILVFSLKSKVLKPGIPARAASLCWSSFCRQLTGAKFPLMAQIPVQGVVLPGEICITGNRFFCLSNLLFTGSLPEAKVTGWRITTILPVVESMKTSL